MKRREEVMKGVKILENIVFALYGLLVGGWLVGSVFGVEVIKNVIGETHSITALTVILACLVIRRKSNHLKSS